MKNSSSLAKLQIYEKILFKKKLYIERYCKKLRNSSEYPSGVPVYFRREKKR